MKNQISRFLIANLEAQGYDLKLLDHKKITVGLKIENPLEKLKIKGILTQEEYQSCVEYQQDYELANQTHHSRPSYENLRTDGGKVRDFDLKDNQVQASKNIQIIKSLIDEREKSFEEYNESRGRRRSKGLNKTLNLVFERQLAISRVKIITRMSFELIEKRAKEVAIVINNYYRN